MDKLFPLIQLFPSRKEWERACWKIIIKSPKIFECIVTVGEQHNLVIRAVAIHYVHLGKSYQQIAKELLLSPQTICSIRKAMQESTYKSYRERGKIERKKKLYSHTPARPQTIHSGKPVGTKYGKIYLP